MWLRFRLTMPSDTCPADAERAPRLISRYRLTGEQGDHDHEQEGARDRQRGQRHVDPRVRGHREIAPLVARRARWVELEGDRHDDRDESEHAEGDVGPCPADLLGELDPNHAGRSLPASPGWECSVNPATPPVVHSQLPGGPAIIGW